MIQSDPTQTTPEPASGDRAGAADESAQSLSLLGGVAGAGDLPQPDAFDDEALGGASGRGLSRGTLLVILVAIVAFGALYAMRVMQGDVGNGGDAQVEARMEQILAKLANPDALDETDPLRPENMQGLFQDTDAIVASLVTDLTGRQVPAEFVKKNPFALPIEEEPEPEVVDDTAERRAAQRRELENELQTMNLQSVMGSGSNAVAVIDGEIHRQGDTLGSLRIEAIDASAQTVTFVAGDHQLTLTMGN